MNVHVYKDGGVYLDNAATTMMKKEVIEAMAPFMDREYGNASAACDKGVAAREAVEAARCTIADSIGAAPTEIYFTSGGSESDNWAIKGTAEMSGRDGGHIITTCIEHHAVLNSCRYLEMKGYRVTYLPVDRYGMISLDRLEQEICPDTILVSVMYGNNEVGTIEPVAAAARIAKERGVTFHTDAVQAYCQVPISVKKLNADMMSVSAHKFHGPKGVGFLYIKNGVSLPSFIHGGGQEMGKRAGTENVPGIVGMARACELAHENMAVRMRRIAMLRNYMIERVRREIPGVLINGHPTMRLPGNVNVSFLNVDGASLIQLLDEDKICVSGGSACNTGAERISYVIKALGVPEEYAAGTVRMTLSSDTTKEDIDRAVISLKRNVARLYPPV
jgi:cysteine desulfurase